AGKRNGLIHTRTRRHEGVARRGDPALHLRGFVSSCDKAAPPRRRSQSFANSWPGSTKAFISIALPEGARKNIVACSPGWPWKRTWGSMTSSVPAAASRSARARQSSSVSTMPKCGTGTSWPSTGFEAVRGTASGARWDRRQVRNLARDKRAAPAAQFLDRADQRSLLLDICRYLACRHA